MFALTAAQRYKRIVRFQSDEITRLATDKPFALACSKRQHYSCIGDWLTPGRGGRVLEIGCGPGRYVAMLANMGYDLVGIDRLNFDSWKVIQRTHKVELVSGVVAEHLPYDRASFDHVACLGALLYFDDADRAFAEIRRVLKPGGRLIVRTVNRGNLVRRLFERDIDPATNNVYYLNELKEFVSRSGFIVHDGFSYGFFPPVMCAYWWYLMNGIISIDWQEYLSNATPASMRINVTVFAERGCD